MLALSVGHGAKESVRTRTTGNAIAPYPGTVPTNQALDASAYTTVEGRVPAALVLGAVSLFGLVFPLLLAAGVAGIYLSWSARKRIASSRGALKGRAAAWIAFALSVVGSLLSLVFPAFVVSVYIYAAFHGGQLPGDLP